jgi:hypothetical protein
VIYDDALRSGWQDWGWAPHNYSNSSPVLSGTYSVSVSISNNTYQGLQIYHPDMDSTPYTNLTFWINGGAGGQKLQVYGLLHVGGTPNADAGARYSLGTLPAGTWQQFVIPLSALNVDQHANFTGIVIQDAIGAVQPTFYVDDISLVTGFTGGSPGTNAPIRIGVDALVNRHPISPLIYGSAFASSNELAELNFTVNRSGGNNQTRYNWQLNAHNIDADWYFESVDDGSPTSGAATDGFILDSRNGGAEPMVTIPMIGWAARLNPDRSTLHS